MTRRLSIVWPDLRPFAAREGAPIRLLAVSDAVDPALDQAINREAIGHVDAIVGCGDLEPSYLGFLGDAFQVPVAYVRGNHDRGGQWAESARHAPHHLSSGRLVDVVGITVAPLEWPGLRPDRARRDEWRAWGDVFRVGRSLVVRRLLGRATPVLVLSHAAPRGVGDHAADRYHLGYAAYRWLLERLRPPLWLHGHTTPATVADWRASLGPSLVANVTGSVLVELTPPASPGR
jgi:Icc-related predicted phosphoesterase